MNSTARPVNWIQACLRGLFRLVEISTRPWLYSIQGLLFNLLGTKKGQSELWPLPDCNRLESSHAMVQPETAIKGDDLVFFSKLDHGDQFLFQFGSHFLLVFD